MQYKIRYRPIEALGPTGWNLLVDENAKFAPPAEKYAVMAEQFIETR